MNPEINLSSDALEREKELKDFSRNRASRVSRLSSVPVVSMTMMSMLDEDQAAGKSDFTRGGPSKPERENSMDAEDFRFHAVRGVAIRRASEGRVDTFSRAQSEIGTMSKSMEFELQRMREGKESNPAEAMSTIIEEVVKEGGASVAKPYLAWACMQLGVQNMYDEFEQRISNSAKSTDGSEGEPEEEMSLEDMIEDNHPTEGGSPLEDLPSSFLLPVS
mmetsp:Transcript_62208/g.148223  ORF Transcript_62208/g.148223 Transcript_62208/m.148223 type:complete len:219 (+) Transcript_62208:119-775(+)